MKAAALSLKDRRPPPELELYNLCQTFNCLPSQIADEDYMLIRRMLLAHNTVYTINRMKGATGKRIHDVPGDIVKFGHVLKKMGLY